MRPKVFLLALNSARLKEQIPPLDGLLKEVNCTYEGLQKVLLSWRDHHISALTKCHSAVMQQVNTVIIHMSQQALTQDTLSSTGPLEHFLLNPGSKMLLMKSQIEKSEAAIAEACILKVASDLKEVQEIFRREYSAPPFRLERVKGYEELEAELNAFQMREEDLLGYFDKTNQDREIVETRYKELLSQMHTEEKPKVSENKQEENWRRQWKEEQESMVSRQNERLNDLQNATDMKVEDYRSTIVSLLATVKDIARSPVQHSHELAEMGKLAARHEETAKLLEAKYSEIEEQLVKTFHEKEKIEERFSALCEDFKTKCEAVTILQEKEKTAKERIAGLRENANKAAKKKDALIKSLESELQHLRESKFDGSHSVDIPALSIESPQLTESMVGDMEANSMKRSMHLSQSALTWDCAKCRMKNPIDLEACQKCTKAKPVLVCPSCGKCSEHFPTERHEVAVPAERPRVAVPTPRPRVALPDIKSPRLDIFRGSLGNLTSGLRVIGRPAWENQRRMDMSSELEPRTTPDLRSQRSPRYESRQWPS